LQKILHNYREDFKGGRDELPVRRYSAQLTGRSHEISSALVSPNQTEPQSHGQLALGGTGNSLPVPEARGLPLVLRTQATSCLGHPQNAILVNKGSLSLRERVRVRENPL